MQVGIREYNKNMRFCALEGFSTLPDGDCTLRKTQGILKVIFVVITALCSATGIMLVLNTKDEVGKKNQPRVIIPAMLGARMDDKASSEASKWARLESRKSIGRQAYARSASSRPSNYTPDERGRDSNSANLLTNS